MVAHSITCKASEYAGYFFFRPDGAARFTAYSFCGFSYVRLMCILDSLCLAKISNLKQAIKHRDSDSESTAFKERDGGGKEVKKSAVKKQMCLLGKKPKTKQNTEVNRYSKIGTIYIYN